MRSQQEDMFMNTCKEFQRRLDKAELENLSLRRENARLNSEIESLISVCKESQRKLDKDNFKNSYLRDENMRLNTEVESLIRDIKEFKENLLKMSYETVHMSYLYQLINKEAEARIIKESENDITAKKISFFNRFNEDEHQRRQKISEQEKILRKKIDEDIEYRFRNCFNKHQKRFEESTKNDMLQEMLSNEPSDSFFEDDDELEAESDSSEQYQAFTRSRIHKKYHTVSLKFDRAFEV